MDTNIKNTDSFKGQLIELESALYRENKGHLYKAMLEIFEKPLLEFVLEQTEGNQFRAARILGINRNTMRAKIKKLGINPDSFKTGF